MDECDGVERGMAQQIPRIRPRMSWRAMRQPAGPCPATWKPEIYALDLTLTDPHLSHLVSRSMQRDSQLTPAL